MGAPCCRFVSSFQVMSQEPPPTFSEFSEALHYLSTRVLPDFLQHLSLRRWLPHRHFTEGLEPLELYYNRLNNLYGRSSYMLSGDDEFDRGHIIREAEHLLGTILTDGDPAPIPVVRRALVELIADLSVANLFFFEFPLLNRDLIHHDNYAVPLRRQLAELEPYLVYEDPLRAAFRLGISFLVNNALYHLPDSAYEAATTAALSVPLVSLMPGSREFVDQVVKIFDPFSTHATDMEQRAFQATAGTIFDNLLRASGLAAEDLPQKKHKLVYPHQATLSPLDLAKSYLAGTPLHALAALPIPFSIPLERRFEHTHVLGGTGHGKTQLLQTLMLNDFDDPERPSVVVIDSQGDMLKVLSRLARFDPAVDDRLIIVDAGDLEWPLRLNMFDVDRNRLGQLSLGARTQILSGILELYQYLFGALFGAELTAKQTVVFNFLAQLMLAIPGANIQVLRDLLDDPTPYLKHIDTLEPTARSFLVDHLFDKKNRQYAETRQQILRRLFHLLGTPGFAPMFSHPKNALDMKAAMDQGKVVLINTAKDKFRSETSAIFGRYMVALVMQAALERAADDERTRRPAFVYIDEAADYFDDNIDTLLIQARKFKVGLILAHQHLDQLTPKLRASVMTNPAVRFAGGVSEKDANTLDGNMKTTEQFLMSMSKRADETEFVCFVRNLTPSAVRITVPLGAAERESRMSQEAYAKLIARVRSQIATPIAEVHTNARGAKVDAPDTVGDVKQSY